MKKINLKSSILLLKNLKQRKTVETFFNKNFGKSPVIIFNSLNFVNYLNFKNYFFKNGIVNESIRVSYLNNFKIFNSKGNVQQVTTFFEDSVISLFSGCLVSLRFDNENELFKFLLKFKSLEKDFKNFCFSPMYLNMSASKYDTLIPLSTLTLENLGKFGYSSNRVIGSVLIMFFNFIKNLYNVLLKNLISFKIQLLLKILDKKKKI